MHSHQVANIALSGCFARDKLGAVTVYLRIMFCGQPTRKVGSPSVDSGMVCAGEQHGAVSWRHHLHRSVQSLQCSGHLVRWPMQQADCSSEGRTWQSVSVLVGTLHLHDYLPDGQSLTNQCLPIGLEPSRPDLLGFVWLRQSYT